MTDETVRGAIDNARVVAAGAAGLRKKLRWKTSVGGAQREAQIGKFIDLIDKAMKPVRSFVGRLAYVPLSPGLDRDLRRASRSLQYERKQLKKMRR